MLNNFIIFSIFNILSNCTIIIESLYINIFNIIVNNSIILICIFTAVLIINFIKFSGVIKDTIVKTGRFGVGLATVASGVKAAKDLVEEFFPLGTGGGGSSSYYDSSDKNKTNSKDDSKQDESKEDSENNKDKNESKDSSNNDNNSNDSMGQDNNTTNNSNDSENKSNKSNVNLSTKSFVLSIASIGSNVNKNSTSSSLRQKFSLLLSLIISTIFKKFKKVGNRIALLTHYFYNLLTRWVSCKNKLIGQFFILPMIINNVSSNVPSDSDSLVRFCLATFILLLLGLFSFISIIGYFVSFYLLQK